MRGLPSLSLLLLVEASVPSVRAGGGPQSVLIVVNDRSIESLEVGQHYQERRGIPERNICHVSVAPGQYAMTAGEFQTSVLDRVTQHVAAQNLASQIDYVVLAKDLPYRVGATEFQGHPQNGASSVMFHGYKPYANFCAIEPGSANGYFGAERAFAHPVMYGGTNYMLSMMLTAFDLTNALALVDRSVSADGSAPVGAFYFVKKFSDPVRNLRYLAYDNCDFTARFFGGFPDYENPHVDLGGRTNVLSFQTGGANPFGFAQNVYLPGAFCDHFTSFGGSLLEPSGQMSILDWIRVGASGAYGTVSEPCAHPQKFPDPMVMLWYGRGFNLGESYWMSVRNPYQGLFVGDPLTAPYARPPLVSFSNLPPHQCVSGIVTVLVEAAAGFAGQTIQALDLLVDDLSRTNVARVPPAAGNRIELTIDAVTSAYVIAAGDTLTDAVDGLATAVNMDSHPVQALARGDRLELVYTNFDDGGTSVVYSASVSTGTASELTIRADALSTNLLPSLYPARELIQLAGSANSGDTVSCAVTLTNGLSVTTVVVASSGDLAYTVMSRLAGGVNTNPALQGDDGVVLTNFFEFTATTYSLATLEARRPGSSGSRMFLDFRVARAMPLSGLDTNVSFSDFFNDNAEVLTARGNLLFACGHSTLGTSLLWDTSAWADGPHELHAVAYDGSGIEVQGHARTVVVVSNTDFRCVLVNPTNGQPVALSDMVGVEGLTTGGSGATTQITLFVEGKALAAVSSAPFTSVWNTLSYGVGDITVQAQAWNDAGESAISEPARVLVARSPTLDTDGDGLADSWEQAHFGTLFKLGGTNDPDGDAVNNAGEFGADTNPNDSNDFFRVGLRTGATGTVEVLFRSSTGRLYEAQFVEDALSNGYAWTTASVTSFWGEGGTQVWADTGAETGGHPATVDQRAYRMRVLLP